MTLGQYALGPWRTHAATLAPQTRTKYVWALKKHLGELADEPLITMDVARLAEHQRLLLAGSKTRTPATPTTVREVFARLSGILQVAVEHGHIPSNPARALRKVAAEPREEVRPLSPVELEHLVTGFTGRDRAIVLLAGHLGLRPLEVRSVRWGAFNGTTLTVGRTRTKRSAARTRVIAVPETTAREMKAWRLESGRPGDEEPIIDMTQNAMKLWARRVLRTAGTDATGRGDVTPYTLRHTHASALHYAGFTIPEAAGRLGHGAGLHVETYAHVIDALDGKRYTNLDALIAAARTELVFRRSSVTAEHHG